MPKFLIGIIAIFIVLLLGTLVTLLELKINTGDANSVQSVYGYIEWMQWLCVVGVILASKGIARTIRNRKIRKLRY